MIETNYIVYGHLQMRMIILRLLAIGKSWQVSKRKYDDKIYDNKCLDDSKKLTYGGVRQNIEYSYFML